MTANAGVLRQRDIGPDAGGENHRIGVDPPAVRQFDALDADLADDARGVGVEQDLDALALDQRLQQLRRRRIELALHQPVHQMNQRDRRAGLGQAVGRLQPEQSAADHDDALLLRGERQQQIDVAAVAKGMHAGEIGAGHVEPQRRRTGGQHQLGKRHRPAVRQRHDAPVEIDRHRGVAVAQRHAVVAPPPRRLQKITCQLKPVKISLHRAENIFGKILEYILIPFLIFPVVIVLLHLTLL